MHAPYVLYAEDLGDFSGVFRKPSILEADDFVGAYHRQAMTPKSYGASMGFTFSPLMIPAAEQSLCV